MIDIDDLALRAWANALRCEPPPHVDEEERDFAIELVRLTLDEAIRVCEIVNERVRPLPAPMSRASAYVDDCIEAVRGLKP